MVSVGRIGIVGVGRMGEALISGLLRSKAFGPKRIVACDILEERRRHISTTYGIECYNAAKEVVANSDLIFIAVKPGDVEKVLKEISEGVKKDKIVISIAAGVALENLMEYLPKGTSIIRAMPNIACHVGEGMIAVCPSNDTPEDHLKIAIEVLGLTGRVVNLEEKYFDTVTGLVGSGPAYIYLVIEALADAGVKLGLQRGIATTLVAQTTLGASKMVLDTKEHPATLRDKVVTPAGTTIEGLLELERRRVKFAFINAVMKAAERAKRLKAA